MRRALTAAALLALAAAPAAAQPAAGPVRPRTVAEDLQMFSQVLNQIRVNHPDSVQSHELFMAAVEGMVRRADPHSYVIRSVRLSPEKEREHRAGRLVPVPIEWDFRAGTPVVASVTPGTAAARQDILPGDVLVAADGQPVRAENAFELEVTLGGPRNSTARLTLERQRIDGSTAELVREVRRENGREGSAVNAAALLAPGTGYVRIATFANERVAEDLSAAVRRLEGEGMQRLVLDLRDNGGGLVDEAHRIASLFLPSGAVVYSQEGRKAELNDTVRVRRGMSQRQYPISVLVNEGTASASELLAGALQDHDRAVVVGRPTFGKSLVMQGFPLYDGSVIVMVIGRLRTPCGRVVQREYRDVRVEDYYRLSRAQRDTAGRPSCRTPAGRTVYGGGGIYPDVVLPEAEPAPLWLARMAEEDVLARWAAAWITANPQALTTAEALAASPRLPDGAVAELRALAARAGVAPPEGAEADARLGREAVLAVASAKWGPAGYYRVAASQDPQVEAAVRAFDTAGALLRTAAAP